LPRRPLFLFALITSLVLQGTQPPPHQISKDYGQLYRPQFHFSPQKHWTNDPNGLVFFEGEYHLFFQYNPFGDQWGHMSWGHAVSRDLLHWKELPVAIPEEHGVMIFTGSTVVDERKSSGLSKRNAGPWSSLYPTTTKCVCMPRPI
jgi:sucrose-6-phosphate hydrolase SacC (GH32 family)